MSTRNPGSETELAGRVSRLESEMRELGEEIEDLSLALFLEERLAGSAGRRVPLENAAHELGLEEALEGGR